MTHGAEGEDRSGKDRTVLEPSAFNLLVGVIVPSPDVQTYWHHSQHRSEQRWV